MTEQQAISKLVTWCNGEVGYHEGAGNYNKYAENGDVMKLLGWKPQNEPWCDTFTDAAFCINFGLQNASRMTYQPIGKGSAACRYSAQFFRENNAFFYKGPHVGDVIFFISAGAINHQGIVTGVSGNAITTVEGNSSDSVVQRNYSVTDSRIAGYGRPKWSVVAESGDAEDETPVEDEIPVEDAKPATDLPTSKLPVICRGDTGEVVRAAQYLLNGRGASCGKYGADGDFGPSTEGAVLAFQRRNKIDPDGVVGPVTWAKLLGV